MLYLEHGTYSWKDVLEYKGQTDQIVYITIIYTHQFMCMVRIWKSSQEIYISNLSTKHK
jgi:hypothetical protein